MNKRGRKERLNSLKDEERTIIFYEAPHKLPYTLKDLKEYFGGERKLVLAREITKIHEEFLRFSIDEAVNYYEKNEAKGEFVILVEGKKISSEKTISEESIESLMNKYLNSGMDKKDAMKQVAKDKGITKSEVYKYLLK